MNDPLSDSQLTPMPRRLRVPPAGRTPGCAVLWRSESDGWSAPPLHLPCPLLLLRVNAQGTRVLTPEGGLVAHHEDRAFTPFHWIEEILGSLGGSVRGTERRLFHSPVFPLAIVCASYEYGRYFHPHEHCFPHLEQSEMDDLFVSFHSTGFVLKNDQWTLVGRPPGPETRWRGWAVSAAQTEWPRPPALSAGSSSRAAVALPGGKAQAAEPCMSPEDYRRALGVIRGHLRAGDIYQANMTVRFDGRTTASPDRVFAAGIRQGGDRFAALVRASDCSHVSFSPELLLRKWGRSICTRPIKGTRFRTPMEDDHEIEEDLAASGKDRAEHIMIVDLERNDLGRLCEYGTIRVDPLMAITRHPTLFHLESTVWGTLRARVGLRDLFAAMFPGGSVTGAPKRRALEIIAELENRPRGIYCGAMGWIDCRGDAELNLPIRTATMYDDGHYSFHGGGGIVADSQPDQEWRELNDKIVFMREAFARASG